MKARLSTRFALAAALAAASVPAAAAPPADADKVVDAVAEAIAAEVQVEPTPAERERLVAVERAIAGQEAGAWSVVSGRQPVYLTLGGAVARALENNLQLRIAGADAEIARQIIAEAQAVFDPVFNLSVGYAHSDTYGRSRIGLVNQRVFTPPNGNQSFCVETGGVPGGAACPKSAQRPSPAIIMLGWNSIPVGGIQPREIDASTEAIGPTEVLTTTIGLDQQLPWGQSIRVAHQTRYQDVLYRKNFAYDEDTTANLFVDLASPLPFTAGFGETAPAAMAVERAQVASELVDWSVRGTANLIIAQTNAAYWNLVAAIEALYVSEQNLALVADMNRRMKRRYDEHLATTYDMTQADAELRRAQVQIEQARAAMVEASEALGLLVENDPAALLQAVYLPVGYAGLLDDWLATDYDRAMALAKANRPAFFAVERQRRLADIDVAVAENLARPSVLASLSTGLRQTGTAIGYDDVFEANRNLFDPDVRTVSGALSYSYALGENAKEAQLESARIFRTDAALAGEQEALQADVDIRNLLAQIDAARAQVKLAKLEVERQAALYDSLVRRQDLGDVTQYQLVLASRDLLNAHQRYVAAVTANKVLEGSLLEAQGTIAATLAGRAAVGEFHRRRQEYVAAAGPLKFFAAERGN